MKLKVDEQGHAVLQDGKPVYVHDDGKEIPFDAATTVVKIGQLNGEAKSHRERAESAEKALKAFEGIENPEEAIKALSTVKNLKDKQLVDAGEVEKIRAEAIKAVEDKYKPTLTEVEQLRAELQEEKIGKAFGFSEFLKKECSNTPVAMLKATFQPHFKLENGKPVAYDFNGNKIYSRTRPGELADFEEAIESLVDTSPFRDQIRIGSKASGGGSTPVNGGNPNKKPSEYTEAERVALYRSNPTKFQQLFGAS